jgi:hypothetical protein
MSTATTYTAGGQAKSDPPALVEAIRLLRMGYWPVAIHSPDSGHEAAGKAPIGVRWGAKRPTEESLRSAWTKHRNASVGLKLGPQGGLIDVEVDDPETGEESLVALLGGEIIETAGWSSARGSHHLFAWDDRLAKFDKNIYKLKAFPGVEIRLNVGNDQIQSVCPPSPTTRKDADGKTAAIGLRRWNGYQTVLPVPTALIRALEEATAEPEPAPKAGPTESPFTARATDGGKRPDAETRAVAYLAKCQPAISGNGGHNQAFKVACTIGPGFDLPEPTALRLIKVHYNPRCDPRWSEKELLHKVTDAYREEPRRGWLLNEDRESYKGKATGAGASTSGQAEGKRAGEEDVQPSRLVMVKASDVLPMPIRWLAPGRIPLGKVTLLAGEGSAGKSSFSVDLAARITRGLPTLGGSKLGALKGPAEVLILGNEDSTADTYIPRLIVAGADLEKVNFIKGVDVASKGGRPVPFAFQHAEVLRRQLEENPNIKLLVIDPIATLAGRSGVNDNRNSELAGHLEPLATLAEERNIAILLIAHLNKGTTNKAVHRIIGSVAYVNVCRCAFVVAVDPEAETRRIMSAVKFNAGKLPKSLAYRIEPPALEDRRRILARPEFRHFNEEDLELMDEQLAQVTWEGETEQSADECLSGDGEKGGGPKIERAKPWLINLLIDAGPEGRPSEEVVEEGDKLGFKRDLLFRLRKQLGHIRAEKSGMTGGWRWVIDAHFAAKYRADASDASDGSYSSDPPF